LSPRSSTPSPTNKTCVRGFPLSATIYSLIALLQLKWDLLGARRDDPIARWGKYSQKPSERAAAAAPADDE
jgi:hypothetical protein